MIRLSFANFAYASTLDFISFQCYSIVIWKASLLQSSTTSLTHSIHRLNDQYSLLLSDDYLSLNSVLVQVNRIQLLIPVFQLDNHHSLSHFHSFTNYLSISHLNLPSIIDTNLKKIMKITASIHLDLNLLSIIWFSMINHIRIQLGTYFQLTW